jgi:ABC-type branched-subunit amino acid transport system substrate-binding protein
VRTDHLPKVQRYIKCLVVLACAFLSLYAASRNSDRANAQQNPLTPEEKRGKQIYVQGSSASGDEILAYLGESSLEVPGSAMACANCHGLDGLGKPEGGVIPSNLTWKALTKPYGVTGPGGRAHPPYSERALELALTRGLDPAGNRLLNIMPRYQMSRQDLKDLIAYLKRLGTDLDPGIDESSIKIGTVVPADGQLAEMGKEVKEILLAYFDEINRQGGIYNRRIELKVAETGNGPAATRANVERLVQDEHIFAMTGAFAVGAEKELFALMADREVPLVGPITLYTQAAPALNRQVFYLLSGLSEQSRALVVFASQKLPDQKSGVAIVSPTSEMSRRVAEAIRDQCKKAGWSAPQMYEYAQGGFDAATDVRKLSRAGQDVVFFLGSGEEALAFMREADQLHWAPMLLLSGTAAGKDILDAPPSFDHKIFISLPTAPNDQTAQGIKELLTLREKQQSTPRHLTAQLSAYAAARILVEGLKIAGKDLSREKLIAALESLYEFETGLTPKITYGPNRRIGALGAYIVSVEKKQFVPASAWINLD